MSWPETTVSGRRHCGPACRFATTPATACRCVCEGSEHGAYEQPALFPDGEPEALELTPAETTS